MFEQSYGKTERARYINDGRIRFTPPVWPHEVANDRPLNAGQLAIRGFLDAARSKRVCEEMSIPPYLR